MPENSWTLDKYPLAQHAIIASPHSNCQAASDWTPITRQTCEGGFAISAKNAKVIVLGDASVGKTSLINRFCCDTFDPHYKSTIGVDFCIERFHVLGRSFALHIWDTAGQERFRSIAKAYYRNAHAILLVYDVFDPPTMASVMNWLEEAQKENEYK
eukprot:Colp12_sorted_trinity150504_noHs@2133